MDGLFTWAEATCFSQTWTMLSFCLASAESSDLLLSLKQGNWSMAEYSVEIWTRASDCGWNDDTHHGIFLKGLNEPIKDELAVRYAPTSLACYVELAIRLDN